MAVFRQSENIWLRSYSNSVQCSNLFHYFQKTERTHVPRRPCSPWCNITLYYVWVFICESLNPHQKQDASPLLTLQYECLYVRVLIPQNDWQERRQARLLLGLGGVTVTIYKLHTYLIRPLYTTVYMAHDSKETIAREILPTLGWSWQSNCYKYKLHLMTPLYSIQCTWHMTTKNKILGNFVIVPALSWSWLSNCFNMRTSYVHIWSGRLYTHTIFNIQCTKYKMQIIKYKIQNTKKIQYKIYDIQDIQLNVLCLDE